LRHSNERCFTPAAAFVQHDKTQVLNRIWYQLLRMPIVAWHSNRELQF
jgi:hypothetical protein